MSVTHEGPVPTRLVAISQLPELSPGEKARFLGCVTRYDISLATLTLEHKYPIGSNRKAFVDIIMVLETLKATDTQIGEWINVIGYVTAPSSAQSQTSDGSRNTASVQAVVLWSAGSIKLQEYEKSLTDKLQTAGSLRQ